MNHNSYTEERMKIYSKKDIIQTPYTQVTLFSYEKSPHKHTFFEFSIVLAGRCLNSVDGNPPIELSRGDLFFITPSNSHQLQLLDPDHKHRDFYISADEMRALTRVYSKDLYENLITIAPNFHYKLTDIQLTYLEEKVAYYNQNLYPCSPEQLKQLHTSIILDLLGFILLTQHKQTASYPAWLSTLIRRLDNLEFIGNSVSEITQTTGYSHGYVCRSFKKYMGKTLIFYHNTIKVRYSTRLLPSHSILEIASMLGWYNPKNYDIAFRKVYHTSPSNYKKMMQKSFTDTPSTNTAN